MQQVDDQGGFRDSALWRGLSNAGSWLRALAMSHWSRNDRQGLSGWKFSADVVLGVTLYVWIHDYIVKTPHSPWDLFTVACVLLVWSWLQLAYARQQNKGLTATSSVSPEHEQTIKNLASRFIDSRSPRKDEPVPRELSGAESKILGGHFPEFCAAIERWREASNQAVRCQERFVGLLDVEIHERAKRHGRQEYDVRTWVLRYLQLYRYDDSVQINPDGRVPSQNDRLFASEETIEPAEFAEWFNSFWARRDPQDGSGLRNIRHLWDEAMRRAEVTSQLAVAISHADSISVRMLACGDCSHTRQ